MGFQQGKKASIRDDLPKRTRKPDRAPPPKPDHNEVRRKLYAVDPEYAERQRRLSRQTYRKDRPLNRRLQNGLLCEGTLREVYTDGMEYPVTVEAYTLPEAARALGRTDLTFKRWLEEDMIPAPILRDTTKGYRQYSAGELQVIARVLQQHEQEFSYYATAHVHTREQIMQQMHGYRATNI